MVRFPTFAVRLLLPASLAIAGCTGSGSSPCRSCDAGLPDAADAVLADGPDGDGAQGDEAPAEVADAAIDTRDARPPATRDVPAGEAPWPTPILDGGYLYVDEFQNANAPGWIAAGTTDRDASLGTWSVILGSSGAVLAQGILDQSTWHIAYSTTPLGADQIIEAQLRIVDFYDASPSSMAALFARYEPGSDSGYLVALRGDGTVIVRRRDHGVTASWGGGVAAGIRAGTWYTVRLEVLGDAINAFIDGHAVYSVTDDAPLTTGGLAFGTVGATLEVDRVAATDLPSRARD